MAIMTSEAEDELGGYWLHTTLARGAASGMFQGDGTTREKKPSPAAGNCLPWLASGKTVPTGRSIQGNLEGIALRKALGRGRCQKMHREVPFREKPGKGCGLGSAVAFANPSVSPVSHVLTGTNLLLVTLKANPPPVTERGELESGMGHGLCRQLPALGTALCSPLSQGFSCFGQCCLLSLGAPHPSQSPLVCISAAVTERSKPLGGQAVLGGQLRMENRAQELWGHPGVSGWGQNVA